MLFDRTEVNFGNVSQGTTQEISVFYIGQEDFNKSGMTTSCGCTSPKFNDVTKEITFSTTFHNKGNFQTVATYKTKEGEISHIIVKATVI